MRKAIELTVRLYIEGDDEPAHDFAESTIRTVREMIHEAAESRPELRIRIKGVAER